MWVWSSKKKEGKKNPNNETIAHLSFAWLSFLIYILRTILFFFLKCLSMSDKSVYIIIKNKPEIIRPNREKRVEVELYTFMT